MSKNKTKFSDIWVNQTTLGKQFGISALAMGKKLKELGLRSKETGTPTQEAIENGFCQSTPLKDGTPFFMWNKAKVAELMQAQGHEKLDAKEIKYRELADDWMRVYKRFQEAVSGIEDEMCYEEAQDIKKQAKRAGLIERVNEIMRDRKFDGELIA